MSAPLNSTAPLKTVMSVGFTPVEAVPSMPVISVVPAAVPLVIHNPAAPAVSMPRNSTSSPKTVKPGVTVALKKPVELAPVMEVSGTVPAAVPSVVHKV